MNQFPPSLKTPLSEILSGLGDTTPITAALPIGGGCINNGMRLETEKNVYFLKWNADPLPGMFSAEAHGLAQLARTHCVRVPQVLGLSESVPGVHPAFLLLEWLEGSGQTLHDQAVLGAQLAEMHRQSPSIHRPPAYGLEQNNYVGGTPQDNTWESDWITFFREHRLRPQIELAQRNRRMPEQRQQRLERVLEHLPDWLGGVQRQPVLLHGDLWSGNVIPSPNGLALIDPAIYYGDREAEIAFTEMFGGFSPVFYQAYQSTWPLDAGYAGRRDLYNLYHLLNHLNLFGESYGVELDEVLKRYVA